METYIVKEYTVCTKEMVQCKKGSLKGKNYVAGNPLWNSEVLA
jgi:hypothetical protein